MPSGWKYVCSALRIYFLFAVIAVGGCSGAGNPDPSHLPPADSDSAPDTTDLSDGSQAVIWSVAFDAAGVGVLSAVWGSSADDVFVVGGTPSQGEIYHFDGAVWQAMRVPELPLLVWIFGFGPRDVTAVGVGGGVVHFDGVSWQRLESGTTKDLWGIWGSAPDDVWIVGGGDGEAVILHFDGTNFTPTAMPANDRDATALFKVWGIGSKIFAVGENGLIIQYEAGAPAPSSSWFQVPTGADADDDFISLWGTSADNIVAVGGRSSARLAVYDGTTWTTHKPAGAPTRGLHSFLTLLDVSSKWITEAPHPRRIAKRHNSPIEYQTYDAHEQDRRILKIRLEIFLPLIDKIPEPLAWLHHLTDYHADERKCNPHP